MIEHCDPDVWADAGHHTGVLGGGLGDRMF
jgi:hypothetical protein